ncbi:MAG TPA: thermonuclease family protein, partial [Gammaproteobacteria bacterium]
MAVPRLAKGALRKGAPFAFLQGLFLLWALLPGAHAAACTLDRGGESVAVDYVYDGDTLRLEDGRKVRFIGINTPEIKRDGSPSEPFSRAARKRVVALTGGDAMVLRLDQERHDRYGRLLAHPYLADGRSLSKLLLQEGLAAAVVVPPNLWHSDCYLQQEQAAR